MPQLQRKSDASLDDSTPAIAPEDELYDPLSDGLLPRAQGRPPRRVAFDLRRALDRRVVSSLLKVLPDALALNGASAMRAFRLEGGVELLDDLDNAGDWAGGRVGRLASAAAKHLRDQLPPRLRRPER